MQVRDKRRPIVAVLHLFIVFRIHRLPHALSMQVHLHQQRSFFLVGAGVHRVLHDYASLLHNTLHYRLRRSVTVRGVASGTGTRTRKFDGGVMGCGIGNNH
jgi:hypothetical protein